MDGDVVLDHRNTQKIVEVATIHIVNEDRASIYTPLRDMER